MENSSESLPTAHTNEIVEDAHQFGSKDGVSHPVLKELGFQAEKKKVVIISTLIACIGGILFGYDVGIISGALLQLRSDFSMTCLSQEIVVTAVPFGAFAASCIGGLVVDKMGRKSSMLANCAVFVLGAILLAFSTSVIFVIAARIVIGFAVGLSAIAEVAYISEISSSGDRGKLVSLNEVAIALGFLLAYLMNYLCINLRYGWRVMFAFPGVIALLQCIGLFCVPKSPRYLLTKNKLTDARGVLVRLRGYDNTSIDSELSSLKSHISADNGSCVTMCSKKDNMLYRLFIAAALVIAQQFSGQPNVLYYTPLILQQMGFLTDQSSTLAAVAVGVTKVVFVVVSLVLVDRIGRKLLLIIGASVMSVTLMILTILSKSYTHLNNDVCSVVHPSSTHYINSTITSNTTIHADISPVTQWCTLLIILAYVAAYSISFGPVTWLILSEIFPTSVKGRCISLATCLNWLGNITISFTFLDYMESVGISGTFLTYSISCLLSVIFVIVFIPETKNRSLESINTSFKHLSLLDYIKQTGESCTCINQSSNATQTYEPLNYDVEMEQVSQVNT